ncbi:MAG TPA: hypothetical protein VNK73_13255 [Actinomycetota bacterium]|nr:hypothetical protein [Actinomycetota bacterium]
MIRPRGDPQRLRLGAKWFQAAAARVEQLGLDLRRHSEAASEVWLGWASFQFHDAMAWAENDCAEAVTAFLAAGAALRRYADALQAAQEEYDAAMAGGTVAGYELRDGAFTDPTPPAPATGPVLGFPSPARATERLEEAREAARLAGEEAAGHLAHIAHRAGTVPKGRHGPLALDPFSGIAERGAVAAGLLRGSLRAGPMLNGDAGQGPPRGAFARARQELDEVLPNGLARGGPVAGAALDFAASVYSGEAAPKALAEAVAGAAVSALMIQQGTLGCLALAETGPGALACEVGVVTASALASLKVQSWVSDLWESKVDPRAGEDRRALTDELRLIEDEAERPAAGTP